MGDKKILFVGHDFKFVNNIIEHIKINNIVKIDKWKSHTLHDEDKSFKLLKWAEVIFCEWCLGNAIWYSKHKLPHQKLYIRLHRHEIITKNPKNGKIYPESVYWNNVNNIIFIAPKIKEILNKKIKNIDSKSKLIFNYVPKNIKFSEKQDNSIRKFNLGLLGCLPMIKRPDIAVKIVQKLIENDIRYKIIIKSKAPQELDWLWKQEKERKYYNNLYKYIEENNLQQNVIFEKHGDVSEWFGKIGYIISCSDIEGSHQAVAEGMYAGCIPMISGNWYYEYGADLIYPKKYCNKDISEIVDKIIYYNKNEEIKVYEQKYCRQYSIQNFNEEKIKVEYQKLIVNNEYEEKFIMNIVD